MDCFIRRIPFVMCLLMILFASRSGIAQVPLKLVNDPWPPYTGDTLPEMGLATDIVVTALKRAGYQTQVEFVPWKRALRGTIKGDYDILLTTSFSEERAKSVAYSDPYLSNTVKLIKHFGAPYRYNSLADLDGLDIVVIDGYLYEPQFDAATNFNRVLGTNTLSNLKMLAAKHADLTVADELVARYHLKNNNTLKDLKIEILPRPLNAKYMHIVIRKSKPGYEKIISDFNRSLEALHKDGTYNAIINRHAPKTVG